MAASTFKKGVLCLVLSGLTFLSLVSGQTSMASTLTSIAPASASSSASSTSPTQLTSTGSSSQTSSTSMSGTSANAASTQASATSASSSTTTNSGGMSGNSTSNTSSTISCPTFTCSYSQCYSMFSSTNNTQCSSGSCCQLLKTSDMQYNASCTLTCAQTCNNSSDINCSVKCCNSTGCLNDTFLSMMSTTTVSIPSTTTTATTPQPSTTTSTTMANYGKKCRSGTCTGDSCYTTFQTLQMCSSTQPHCQLKKETVNSAVSWTAGCANCTGSPVCTTSSTAPPCHLECCTATTTSCLRLNGTLNVPSFATRGPYPCLELFMALLSVLVLSLVL